MYYSGFKWNGLGELDEFVGLENFKRAFNDDVFIGALKHNAIFVVLSLCLQLPFALAVALMLNAKLKGRALLRVLYFAPFVLSEVVTGVVFTLMLQPGGLADAYRRLTASGSRTPGSSSTRCSSRSRGSTSAST